MTHPLPMPVAQEGFFDGRGAEEALPMGMEEVLRAARAARQARHDPQQHHRQQQLV